MYSNDMSSSVRDEVNEIRRKHLNKVHYAKIVDTHEHFVERYPSIFRAIFNLESEELDKILDHFEDAQRNNRVAEEGRNLARRFARDDLLPKFAHMMTEEDRNKAIQSANRPDE